MDIKKYVLCQLADAENEEERLTMLWNQGKADQCELDKIDARIEAYNNILRYIKQNPDERVLWEDVGLGENTKVGDRCYGFDGWFSMDHVHVELQPKVPEGAKPIQRIVNKD